MIKESIGGAVAAVLVGVIWYGVVQGVNAEYLPRDELEVVADNIYIRQDTYIQQRQLDRSWALQDKIDELVSRAEYEGRALTPFEKDRIRQWQSEINKLTK